MTRSPLSVLAHASILAVIASMDSHPVAAQGAAMGGPPLQTIARVQFGPSKTVEVIGLRRWTVAMIQDSLRKYAPGETLDSHACAANLRHLLHFADAMANTYVLEMVDGTDTTRQETIVVSVREPGDSARVHYRSMPTADTTLRADWAELTDLYRHHTPDFNDLAAAFLSSPETARATSYGTPELTRMLRYLGARSTIADLNTALDVLEHSPSAPDRGVAALILANFPDRDEAWHALFRASVQRDQWLHAGLAQDALASLARRHPRVLNWTPVAPLIHDVLDGAGLPAFGAVIPALIATGAATPANAKLFLHGGGEMTTAYLESSRSEVRSPVHDLLTRLRGTDLGLDREAWMHWISTL